MTKKTSILIMAMLTIILAVSMAFLPSIAQEPSYGPQHCKGLDVLFHTDPTLTWSKLKAGEIDIMQWGLTEPQFEEAKLLGDIQLAKYDENGMFEIDLNNNYTAVFEPDRINPVSELSMRQAIAHMIDKDYIIGTIVRGFGGRIDAPIAAPQESYANASVVALNYRYPFSMELAASCLFGELVPVCTDETYVASTWINIEEEQEVHVKSGVVIDMATGGALVPCEPTVLPVGTVLHVEEEAVIHFSDTARFTFRWCDWPKWLWPEIDICVPTMFDPCTYIWLERAGKVHVTGVVEVVNTGAILIPCTDYMLPKGTTLHVIEPGEVHIKSGKARSGHISPPLPPPPLTYPWPYRFKFRKYFLNGLFPVGTDGDRFHDANGNGVKEAGENLLLKLCIRDDHDERLETGRYLDSQLISLNVPTNPIEASSDVLYPMVMGNRDYHIYTGGWILGRYPTNIYGTFHSDFDFIPDGDSYCGGKNATGQHAYPEMDEACEEIYFAPTMPAFIAGVKKATGIHAEFCINIPLWSDSSWWGYRKNLVGIVNMDGYGLENEYTFLHAKKLDDPATPQDESQEPIRMGTVNLPKKFNIIYSTWYYDFAVLDRMFSSGMSVQPRRLEVDQPWVFQDWEEDTWLNLQLEDDPQTPEDERECTMVRYYLRKDVYWVAPVTGEKLQQFTAHDVEFSQWYQFCWDKGHQYSAFMDVHHTCIIDEFTIDFYFNEKSIFVKYGPTGPLLKKGNATDGWLYLFCEPRMVEVHIDEPIEPCMKFELPTEDHIVQVINATKYPEDIPLVECSDFQIVSPPEIYKHNWFHWKGEGAAPPILEPCETIVIWYWTPAFDPKGTYPGADEGLSWEDSTYCIGYYYPIAIVEGAGGYASFECNQHMFLETPPEGEIDWMWTWDTYPTPGPEVAGRDGGYYQVFLYDAVRVASAYGSRGDKDPSTNWDPDADVDETARCWIYLYDATTVSGQYGKKFGIPPDP